MQNRKRRTSEILRPAALLLALLSGAVAASCSRSPETQPGAPARYTLRVLDSIPHDGASFTQGLLFHNGRLFESTGLAGSSSLREIDPATGNTIRISPVPEVFAEGLALFGDRLFQLTYKERVAYVYNLRDFALTKKFEYDGEGWGLTSDGKSLIMSDGSDSLYFRNPDSFKVERVVKVTLEGEPLEKINELEFVKGLIFANVWKENFIVQIRPADGVVVGVIDAADLAGEQPEGVDVLNGIAYDEGTGALYITGKYWPKIYKVALVEAPPE